MLKTFEILPIIIFFLLYKLYNIFVATAGIAFTAVFVTFIQYLSTKKISKFHLINTGVLLLLSTTTLILQDSSFVKMKPTFLYLLLALFLLCDLIFLQKLYIQKFYKSLLEKIHKNHEIKSLTWKKITISWIISLICIAITNELIWRYVGEEMWVSFKVFILPSVLFCILVTHIMILSKKSF